MKTSPRQSRLRLIWQKVRANRARILVGAGVFAVLALASVVVADRVCRMAAAGRIFRSVEQIPANEVALVLGTGKFTASGRPNLHFTQRINAAFELYRSGKVQHLLVSGDNHVATYDEPTDMMNALVAAGIPTNVITRDYAGFRTLDSVVRANSVFGLKKFTIVTEEFHCPRALWIAKQHGLNTVAFAAPDLSARWSLRVKARESLARVLCGFDLYLLNRSPKFPGPPEPIVLTAAAPGGQ
ncbi:MAG TPA: ElyC/SanA/YdcF family protein [Verrucomicrobiae bacterium]|nr:ElyC/SanA/YdcF family protein [Verrucomicrobiae bacterium]